MDSRQAVTEALRSLCRAIRLSTITVDGRSLECEFAEHLLAAEEAISQQWASTARIAELHAQIVELRAELRTYREREKTMGWNQQ